MRRTLWLSIVLALSAVVVAAVSVVAWGWTGPWVFLEGVALTSCSEAGRSSVTTTLVAGEGPAFETVIV